VADAEHVVDDLEPLVLGGVVDGGNVRDLCVLGRGVVFEKGEDGDDAGGGDADGQFVFPDREPAMSDVASRGPGQRTAERIWADMTSSTVRIYAAPRPSLCTCRPGSRWQP
jgi:hypothetical protein